MKIRVEYTKMEEELVRHGNQFFTQQELNNIASA